MAVKATTHAITSFSKQVRPSYNRQISLEGCNVGTKACNSRCVIANMNGVDETK
ncbi:MAG: hypothetical protein Aurels2KO_15900 [Aureliella sp.]